MGRILVIDDEDQVRGMLRRALEAAGHQVLEARDGRDGLRVYRSHPVDLVVTDILMPERDGLECIMEMRALDPGVRIIAISGGTEFHAMDVLDVARRFGARRTFWKPFDLEKVLAAVREELTGRTAA